MEHFVTLFSSNYLIFGLALHQTLQKNAGPFCLWVVCMDKEAFDVLGKLGLPNMQLISLDEIETQEHLKVKSQRTFGEYCWTMTPFTFTAVLKRDPSIERVTYLDSDVGFFRNPQILLAELKIAHKEILITEHAYDPRYDQTETSGRFCVQFVTFSNTNRSLLVCKWWQDRCMEWCFNRSEDGKFGDQKYLDNWPVLFPDVVHILKEKHRALGPWNINFYSKQNLLNEAVFYHFHGARFVSNDRVRLFDGYYIGKKGRVQIYDRFLKELIMAKGKIEDQTQLPMEAKIRGLRGFLGVFKRSLLGRRLVVSI